MSTSEQDILSHFASLDELIQLIYQGAHKFVVISSVGELSWDVHLGLTGPNGRWWKGKWTERDIQQFVVGGLRRDVFLLLRLSLFSGKGSIFIYCGVVCRKTCTHNRARRPSRW